MLSREDDTSTRSCSQSFGLGISQDFLLASRVSIGKTTPPLSVKIDAPEPVSNTIFTNEKTQIPKPLLERVKRLVKEMRDRQQEFKVSCPGSAHPNLLA